MNQREMEKHLVFQVSFIIFLIFTIAFTIFWLLTDNVNASDYHNVVTNAIYTGTTHCVQNQTGICVASTSSTTWGRYSLGSGDSYDHILSMNFWLNTSVRKNVNATIRLTGKNWANVPYTCQTNYFTDCRVVRASSTILNINFSNNSNGVSGVEFFITANGSVINNNDIFNIQKADLYETNIVDSDAQNSQDIINNQNQNTEDIINNNNQNTQDVINNQNQNTQSIIDKMTDLSYPSCDDGPRYFIVGADKSYLSNVNGLVSKNNNYWISQPIKITGGKSYELNIVNATGIQYGYYCFYSNLNERLSCTKYNDNTQTSYTFTAPSNAVYFRATLYRSNQVFLNAYLKGRTCVPDTYENNVIQFHQLLEESEVNDFIKDDSNPSVDNSAISDTLESVAIDDPLNYLLTLPFHAIQRINYQLGRNSCEPINLGSLYGTDLILPCINVKEKLGTSLFNLIDTLMGIGILSVTLKKFYDSISNVLTLGKEKEVREKLELPTPMEFLAMIFGGGR